MGAGAAARLVPAGAIHRASSLITAGISAGTVVSLPLGALAGWQTAFMIGAAAALLALAALSLWLPALPPTGAVRAATFTASLRTPATRTALMATGPLLVSVCQVALAAGSLIGGMVVDGYGTSASFAVGGTLTLLSAATQLRPRLPLG
jgi:predicted MFS family arabinose efflux permease